MKKNMGSLDRIFRFVIGLSMLSLLYILEGDARYFGLIGLILIATSTFRFCPAYILFGLNTCEGEGKGSCCGGGSCDTDKPAEAEAETENKDSE